MPEWAKLWSELLGLIVFFILVLAVIYAGWLILASAWGAVG